MINKIPGIIGLLLGVSAIVVASVYPAKTLETTLIAVAASVLLIWFLISRVEAFKTFSARRTAYLRLNTLLMIVFFIFIVILLNLIIRQYYLRYDYSSEKKYSLAPQSEVVAKNIDHDVQVMFFGTESAREFKRMFNMLESYRYLNKKIVYDMYDLDRVPLIANKYGVNDYNTVVVRSGDKTVTAKGVDEETLTNLLIRVTRKKSLKIGYLEGHNEHPLRDESRNGYSVIARKMEDIGYRVEPVSLLSSGGVPWDTDVLIIAGPGAMMTDEENRMLSDYRNRGGKFLILINSPDQLRHFLASLGLEVSRYPVYDPVNVAGTDPSVPLVTRYYASPVTRNFGLSTVYPGAYEVNLVSRDVGYKYEIFARSSRESWFEMNGDGIRQKEEEDGRQVIGAVLSHKDELMKVVVFGDSDFASNAYVSVSGNKSLFLNAVNWLAGEGAFTEVSPGKKDFIPMFITDEQSKLLRFIPLGIPLIIVIAGTLVWYRRRAL